MGAWLDRPVPAAVALHDVTSPSDNVLVDILVVAEDALLALVGWGTKEGKIPLIGSFYTTKIGGKNRR